MANRDQPLSLTSEPKTRRQKAPRGRLRIGDQAIAISIIALSQSNPLKAVAESVENSLDAKATEVYWSDFWKSAYMLKTISGKVER